MSRISAQRSRSKNIGSVISSRNPFESNDMSTPSNSTGIGRTTAAFNSSNLNKKEIVGSNYRRLDSNSGVNNVDNVHSKLNYHNGQKAPPNLPRPRNQ